MVSLSYAIINSPFVRLSNNSNGVNLLLGMRYHSKEDEWYAMFDRMKEETDPSEKNKIMTGLAGIQSTEILKKLVLNPLLTTF